MPFTGSHPAAVLPLTHPALRRLHLAPSALAIGSMVPDTSLFVPGFPVYRLCHSALGIVTLDVALGLVGLLVWHTVIGPAAAAAAPAPVRRRLGTSGPGGIRACLAGPGPAAGTVAALLIGSLPHVVWDLFTHYGRWGTRHIAWLHQLGSRTAAAAWAVVIGAAATAGLVAVARAVASGSTRFTALGFVAATRSVAAGVVTAVVLAALWAVRTRLTGRPGSPA